MPKFEWDEQKNKSNQKKHKIDFEDAIDIFNDKDRITRVSNKKGESRYLTVGKTFLAITTVVFTFRNFVVRIISARRATKMERRAYLKHKLKKQDDSHK